MSSSKHQVAVLNESSKNAQEIIGRRQRQFGRFGEAPEVTFESCVVDVVVADVVGVRVVSSSSCFRTGGQRFFLLAVCVVAPAFLAVCVSVSEGV